MGVGQLGVPRWTRGNLCQHAWCMQVSCVGERAHRLASQGSPRSSVGRPELFAMPHHAMMVPAFPRGLPATVPTHGDGITAAPLPSTHPKRHRSGGPPQTNQPAPPVHPHNHPTTRRGTPLCQGRSWSGGSPRLAAGYQAVGPARTGGRRRVRQCLPPSIQSDAPHVRVRPGRRERRRGEGGAPPAAHDPPGVRTRLPAAAGGPRVAGRHPLTPRPPRPAPACRRGPPRRARRPTIGRCLPAFPTDPTSHTYPPGEKKERPGHSQPVSVQLPPTPPPPAHPPPTTAQ